MVSHSQPDDALDRKRAYAFILLGATVASLVALIGAGNLWNGSLRLAPMIVGTIFAAALASWVARRMLVGPIPADVDEQVEPWTHWLTMVLSGTVLGTAVIGLPLLAAMIIALVIDWHVTEMVPAFVAVLFLTATCRATIWIVINIGLISVVRRRRTDI